MVTIITKSATCSGNGAGFTTTWTLTGSTTAYTGDISATDGYKLKATLTFKNGSETSATSPVEVLTAGAKVGAGTCVETLDSAGAAIDTSVTTNGNFAICHYFFYTTTANTTDAVVWAGAYTATTQWGLTTYLNTTQWGTAGNGIIGTGMNTATGGTGITTADWGLVLTTSDTTETTKLVVDATYNWEWYQPKDATTYTGLRRYGGGFGDATADKVKGYCVSQRLLTGATNNIAGIVAGSTVDLTGASALAAGAIALGVAALAI